MVTGSTAFELHRFPGLFARPAFAPVVLWLGVQMAALGLAAMRVPLSARYPAPAEQLAVQVMLVAQVAASALLFPLLMRNFATAAIVIFASVPFLQFATILAAQAETPKLVALCFYVPLWLLALALGNAGLRTMQAKRIGVAIALLLSLGAATLVYLRREFGDPTTSLDFSRVAGFGPILGGLAILETGPRSEASWIFLATAISVAALGLIVMKSVGKSGKDSHRPPQMPSAVE